MAGEHLVEGLLGHKPGEGDTEAQRRYDELPRFYVVANLYEQDTAIGEHSDSNPLYVVPPPSNKWSSVATWWQMGSCGFHPQRRPACRTRQATYPLSG